MKPKKVAIFISDELYHKFKVKLAEEQISISKKLASWIEKYLSNNTLHTPSTPSTPQKTLEPNDNVNPSQFTNGYSTIGKKETKPIKKEAENEKLCIHGDIPTLCKYYKCRKT